jgi:glycosyltransferase involved in cell wall biosynthesis
MKVLFQSRKTLYSAPGGDTTQFLKTKEYLENLGIQVDISVELQPNIDEYNIIHVFNLMRPQEIYLQIKNAKQHNKKVALSTIYGPYTEYEKKARGGFLQLLNQLLSINQIEYLKVIARAILNFELNKGTLMYLLIGHKRLQKRIVSMVDVFLPNSDSEMKRVIYDFKMEKYNYVTVPNAVDISKFDYDKVTIDSEFEKYIDCVLCVSRIEGRKNQLNVIRACLNLPYKFVFIGRAGANFKKYFDKCKTEANKNMFFLGQIEHEKLPQFYKLAKVHILASWMETPGLSSLEAAIMKTNIVVTKKGDTEDYFKNYAFYCEPNDLNSIQAAVIEAYNAPFDNNLYRLIEEKYKWENTATETLKGYFSIEN